MPETESFDGHLRELNRRSLNGTADFVFKDSQEKSVFKDLQI